MTMHLCILLHYLLWRWTQEEVKINYPSNCPIGNRRSLLQGHI